MEINGNDDGSTIFHRLYAVDAPELYSITFINTNGQTFKRRNGHLCHLALRYYISQFSSSHITRESLAEPLEDRYKRHLSSFWFVWLTPPIPEELQVLDDILTTIVQEPQWVKERLVSTSDPRDASNNQPFFLNLNALLVLAGFCHVFTK